MILTLVCLMNLIFWVIYKLFLFKLFKAWFDKLVTLFFFSIFLVLRKSTFFFIFKQKKTFIFYSSRIFFWKWLILMSTWYVYVNIVFVLKNFVAWTIIRKNIWNVFVWVIYTISHFQTSRVENVLKRNAKNWKWICTKRILNNNDYFVNWILLKTNNERWLKMKWKILRIWKKKKKLLLKYLILW